MLLVYLQVKGNTKQWEKEFITACEVRQKPETFQRNG